MSEAPGDDVPTVIANVFRKQFKQYDGPVVRSLSAAQVPGWDSLSHAELIMSIEDAVNIRLDPAAAFEYNTLGDLVDDIQRQY